MLARSCGRLDWWNVWAEHTPYEWACQQAMFAAEPFGDTRADIRSALATIAAVANSGMVSLREDQAEDIYEKLVNYTHGIEDAFVSPDEAARLVG